MFSSGLGATLQAAGAVGIAGTLRPDFGGVAPAVGSTWNLLEGTSVSGAFSSIDSSLAGSLGAGQALLVSTTNVAGGRKSVRLSLRQLAVLNVNRDTGVVSLTNPGTTPVSIDSYSITSTLGSLGATGWSSLQDQGALGGTWRESPASSNRVSELKRTGIASLAGGQSVLLGALFAPNPASIGAPTDDLTFQFASPEGSFDGIVTYTGTKVNNLLLQVDPSSGQARLRNPSNFTVQVDGYTISSAAGSLTPATWTSLDDQNAAGGDWRESPGTSGVLSELKRAAFTTLAPGASFNLGTLLNTSLPKDLVFQYLAFGQSQPQTAQVLYAAIGGGIPGGSYPMFGSAQMSIIPAKVAGVNTVVACTPPVKGAGCFPATINAMTKAGADRIFIVGGVPAMAMMAFGLGGSQPVDVLCGACNEWHLNFRKSLPSRLIWTKGASLAKRVW